MHYTSFCTYVKVMSKCVTVYMNEQIILAQLVNTRELWCFTYTDTDIRKRAATTWIMSARTECNSSPESEMVPELFIEQIAFSGLSGVPSCTWLGNESVMRAVSGAERWVTEGGTDTTTRYGLTTPKHRFPDADRPERNGCILHTTANAKNIFNSSEGLSSLHFPAKYNEENCDVYKVIVTGLISDFRRRSLLLCVDTSIKFYNCCI